MYQVENQTGKLFIITGANSGTGKEAAKRIAAAGATVIMAVRSLARGETARQEILSEFPKAKLELRQLDLSDLASVKAFAEAVKSDQREIDVLINNAGLMNTPKRFETTDGFELQMGTNFFGPFALTLQLLPKLLSNPNGARITTMSSGVANFGKIDFDDINWTKRKYSGARAYCQSKLADLLFVLQLARISTAKNWKLLVNTAHPGYTRTNLQTSARNLAREKDNQLPARERTFLPSMAVEEGVDSLLLAATSTSAKHGVYYGPRRFGLTGEPHECKIPRTARSEKVAQKLWETSEKITKTAI